MKISIGLFLLLVIFLGNCFAQMPAENPLPMEPPSQPQPPTTPPGAGQMPGEPPTGVVAPKPKPKPKPKPGHKHKIKAKAKLPESHRYGNRPDSIPGGRRNYLPGEGPSGGRGINRK